MKIILFLRSVFAHHKNNKMMRAKDQAYLKELEKCTVCDKDLLEEIAFIKRGLVTLNWLIKSSQGLINQLYIFAILVMIIVTNIVIYFIY